MPVAAPHGGSHTDIMRTMESCTTTIARRARALAWGGAGVLAATLVASCAMPGGDAPDSAEIAAIVANDPPFGTNVPLDSARLVAVLNTPTSAIHAARLPPDSLGRVMRDERRLGWLWQMVGKAQGADAPAWLADARRLLAVEVAEWRNSPGSAPAAAVLAAQIERVPDAELMVLHRFREPIARRHAAVAARPDYHTVHPDDPEARAWLAQGDDRVGLAGNRFDSAVDAAQFVDGLYAAGAVRVVIAQESMQAERDGFYADAIRVVLPLERAARTRLFRLLDAEATDQGYDAEPDTGQAVYYMWWD